MILQLLLPRVGVWLKKMGLDNSGMRKEHMLEWCLHRFVSASRSFLSKVQQNQQLLSLNKRHGNVEKKPPILALAPFAWGLLSEDPGVCVCGLKVTLSRREALLSCLSKEGRLSAVQPCKQFPSALVQAIQMNLVSK